MQAIDCIAGILNEGMLEVCLERPQNHLYGYNPFPDLFEKAFNFDPEHNSFSSFHRWEQENCNYGSRDVLEENGDTI